MTMITPGWMKKVKAVGFDVDGTLYPPQAIPREVVYREQMRAVMVVQDWDEQTTHQQFQALYARLGSNTKTMTALGVDGPTFFTDCWDRLPLRDYIHRDEELVEVFGYLRKRVRLFIISNSNRVNQIQRKLRMVGLQPKWFEVVVSTVGLGAVKPDPKPFMVALEQLNEIHPGVEAKQCLFVGDQETTDVQGAKGVGMRTCRVWVEAGVTSGADILLPRVHDVRELVG